MTADDTPLPKVKPPGKYDQTHEPVGVVYGPGGCQDPATFRARKENRRRVLPQQTTTNDWDPLDW